MANSYRKGAQGQVRLIYLSFPFVLALSLFGTATMKPCIDRVQNEARQSTIVAFFLAIFFFKTGIMKTGIDRVRNEARQSTTNFFIYAF